MGLPEKVFYIDSAHKSLKHFLSNLYGEEVLNQCKLLDKLRIKRVNLLTSLAFLLRCREQNTVPKFVIIKNNINSKKATRIYRQAELALVRERIQEIRRKLDSVSSKLYKLHLELSSILNNEDWDKLDALSSAKAELKSKSNTKRQTKKFEAISKKDIGNNKHLDQDRVVQNLSDYPLSDAAKSLLAKGLNFAITPKSIPVEDIISNVESAIRDLPAAESEEIRQETSRILRKSKPPTNNISAAERKTIRELNVNKNIIILPADKGNVTVVLNTVDYESKIRNLLDNPNYKKLTSNPTNKIDTLTKKLIKSSTLKKEDHWMVMEKAPRTPVLYGLPKIHKPGAPLRPIVSTIGGPTYKLAQFLSKKLQPLTGKTTSFIKDSPHFIELIKDVRIGPEDLLVSFDVESLFTNVPLVDTMTILEDMFPEDIRKLFRHCLTSSHFTFKGEFYQQTEGVAMGSPLSPVVANLFMEHFEKKVLDKTPHKPALWLRYVDDTFVIWPHGKDKLESFLSELNNAHPNIKFTCEMETNGSIPFLDVLVTRKNDGTLGHKVYRKPTHTGRYLNAHSHHHPAQKRGIIATLATRARRICEQPELAPELETLKDSLERNGYERKTINRVINNKPRPQTIDATLPHKFRAFLPYIQNTTDKISRLLRKHNINTVFRAENKLSNLLRSAKDRIASESDGIYKLDCKKCKTVYIGQTSRSISTRMKEHERAFRLKRPSASAPAEHALTTGHSFEFEKPEVLCRPKGHYTRLVRESIEIHKCPININRDDGLRLRTAWYPALK